MKKRIIIIAACFALVLSAALFVAFGLPSEIEPIPERLSEEKADILREELPLISRLSSRLSMVVPPLDHVINNEKGLFIHAKVVEAIPEFKLSVSDGAYSGQHRFFGYTLEIVNDTEASFKKGDVITVSANVLTQMMFPELKKGEEIVTHITAEPVEGRGGKYGFSSFGMFYVTEEGYCFSAYDMKDAVALDGAHVRELMEKQLRRR